MTAQAIFFMALGGTILWGGFLVTFIISVKSKD
jgi:hypothetical protein